MNAENGIEFSIKDSTMSVIQLVDFQVLHLKMNKFTCDHMLIDMDHFGMCIGYKKIDRLLLYINLSTFFHQSQNYSFH